VRMNSIRGVRSREGSREGEYLGNDLARKTKISGLRQSSILSRSSMETRIKQIQFDSSIQYFYDDLFASTNSPAREESERGSGVRLQCSSEAKNNNRSKDPIFKRLETMGIMILTLPRE
jgi:hypothetical protein